MHDIQTLSNPKKVLVIRFSSMGDILLVTPSIRALRNHFPDAEITMLVRSDFSDLVMRNPHLNRVLTFSRKEGYVGLKSLIQEIERWGPDLIIDLHRSARSQIITSQLNRPTLTLKKERLKRQLLFLLRVNRYGRGFPNQIELALETLKPLGVDSEDIATEMTIGKSALYEAGEILSRFEQRYEGFGALNRPWIALVPSSRWPLKCWPERRFSELLNEIGEKRLANVALLGGAQDEICRRLSQGREHFCLDLHGKTSIELAGGILKKSELALSNDTGLMHVAEAVGTDVIAIMGPTTKELGFFPYRKRSRVVEKNLFCRPCTRGAGKCWRFGSRACLTQISASEVYEVVASALKYKLPEGGSVS